MNITSSNHLKEILIESIDCNQDFMSLPGSHGDVLCTAKLTNIFFCSFNNSFSEFYPDDEIFYEQYPANKCKSLTTIDPDNTSKQSYNNKIHTFSSTHLQEQCHELYNARCVIMIYNISVSTRDTQMTEIPLKSVCKYSVDQKMNSFVQQVDDPKIHSRNPRMLPTISREVFQTMVSCTREFSCNFLCMALCNDSVVSSDTLFDNHFTHTTIAISLSLVTTVSNMMMIAQVRVFCAVKMSIIVEKSMFPIPVSTCEMYTFLHPRNKSLYLKHSYIVTDIISVTDSVLDRYIPFSSPFTKDTKFPECYSSLEQLCSSNPISQQQSSTTFKFNQCQETSQEISFKDSSSSSTLGKPMKMRKIRKLKLTPRQQKMILKKLLNTSVLISFSSSSNKNKKVDLKCNNGLLKQKRVKSYSETSSMTCSDVSRTSQDVSVTDDFMSLVVDFELSTVVTDEIVKEIQILLNYQIDFCILPLAQDAIKRKPKLKPNFSKNKTHTNCVEDLNCNSSKSIPHNGINQESSILRLYSLVQSKNNTKIINNNVDKPLSIDTLSIETPRSCLKTRSISRQSEVKSRSLTWKLPLLISNDCKCRDIVKASSTIPERSLTIFDFVKSKVNSNVTKSGDKCKFAVRTTTKTYFNNPYTFDKITSRPPYNRNNVYQTPRKRILPKDFFGQLRQLKFCNKQCHEYTRQRKRSLSYKKPYSAINRKFNVKRETENTIIWNQCSFNRFQNFRI